jgi:hypothetical protein
MVITAKLSREGRALSVGVDVAVQARVWVDVSERLGTSGAVSTAGLVGTLITVCVAGATVAAEGHGVGEERVGMERATR